MDKEWVIGKFSVLLPLAVRWAARQEQRILRHGVALTAQEMGDAKAVGVRDAERVRLLPVKMMPWPGGSALRAASAAAGFVTTATRGLTLSHGIFIRQDCWRNRELIAHELVHTAQYERFGGVEPFLRKYLTECLTVGYVASPLEAEAVRLAASLFL